MYRQSLTHKHLTPRFLRRGNVYATVAVPWKTIIQVTHCEHTILNLVCACEKDALFSLTFPANGRALTCNISYLPYPGSYWLLISSHSRKVFETETHLTQTHPIDAQAHRNHVTMPCYLSLSNFRGNQLIGNVFSLLIIRIIQLKHLFSKLFFFYYILLSSIHHIHRLSDLAVIFQYCVMPSCLSDRAHHSLCSTCTSRNCTTNGKWTFCSSFQDEGFTHFLYTVHWRKKDRKRRYLSRSTSSTITTSEKNKKSEERQ